MHNLDHRLPSRIIGSQAPVPDLHRSGVSSAAGPAQLSTAACPAVSRQSSVACRLSTQPSVVSRLSTQPSMPVDCPRRLSICPSIVSRLQSVVCRQSSAVCSQSSIISRLSSVVFPSVRLSVRLSVCPSVVSRLSSVHPAVNVSRMSPVNVCLSMSDVSDGPGMPETERNSRQAVFVQSRAKVSGTTRYFRAAST